MLRAGGTLRGDGAGHCLAWRGTAWPACGTVSGSSLQVAPNKKPQIMFDWTTCGFPAWSTTAILAAAQRATSSSFWGTA